MKVEEANSILNNPHMQKADCNFKLTKQNPGQTPQWFKDWYSDFSNKLFARLDKQDKFNEAVVKRLDKIDVRLDKQEKFNEEMVKFKDMVLDQFKKHKWIK